MNSIDYYDEDEMFREAEKFFCYVSEHWNEYMDFCVEHDPDDFPIPEFAEKIRRSPEGCLGEKVEESRCDYGLPF